MGNAPHLVVNAGGHASLLGSALGGYEVQSLIGRGAVGTVYLARDTALNRPVALKVLLGSLARNPAMVRSFHREAQAAAPLRHPCIVRIFSAGIESGTPYIAMEYVPGEPLDRFLRRKGQLTWQTALYIGAQVAEALECAHAAGVVHRDVKPANILLDRQGRVRLTDFGIARIASADACGPMGKMVIGTPAYMSPEQVEGTEPSPQTDLYALGVVLFQMIAGQLPFHAESPYVLTKQILTDEAPRLNKLHPGVPDDVARLVAHLLEKTPEDRPRSAWHVCRTIERLQSEDGGRSAIPEALAAYVREQAGDASLRLITPPAGRGSKPERQTSGPKMVPPATFFGSKLLNTCAVAVGLLVLITAGLVGMQPAGGRPVPAPVIELCAFRPASGGAIVAELATEGFTFQRHHWAGDVLIVEAQGRQGSLLQGTVGLLSMDPVARVCASVHAPQTPLSDDGPTPAPLNYRILPVTSSGPLAGSVFMTSYDKPDRSGASPVAVYLQHVTAALPGGGPVLVAPAQFERSGLVSRPSPPGIAPHPGGHMVCLVVRNPDGTSYLAERDMRWRDTRRLGPPLTPAGSRIVGGSVQYDPPGNRIAYMREDPDGARTLWVTPRGSETAGGVLLDVGRLSDTYAFSPDGALVAFSAYTADGAEPEIRIADAATGTIVARPARGAVGPESWLPSGEAILIVHAEPGSAAQLWSLQLSGPCVVRQVTDLDGGVTGTAAVSPSGRWVAGIAADTAIPAIVFVPWGTDRSVVAEVNTPGAPVGHGTTL